LGWGKFYGIGVGPGDPELLTLKARRILEEIEVLFVPKSKTETRSLALTIVANIIDKNWECHELLLPMTRDEELLQQSWQIAARQVIEVIKSGRDAAFITLGDPGLYSSFTYIFRHLKQLAPLAEVEIVPGVSSINSLAAWIQEPLAVGNESLLIVPAGLEKDKISALMEQTDNILLLKAGSEIEKIKAILSEQPNTQRAFLVSRNGFADSFYADDLNGLEARKFDYLSTVLIKKNREGSKV
jgi:precorrin-2/cobalt-factor-2 C20-methyltransferase